MITAETKTLLGIVAPAVGAIGDAIYIWSILRGTTRPHLFSWVVWMLMLAIVFCGQLVSGAGPGAWFTGYNVLANIVIIILAAFYGERACTRGDWIALVIALMGIPIWIMTKDPIWSICLETAIGAVIYYPTFRKSYNSPYGEHPSAYIMFVLPIFIQLFAMDNYTATTLIYPICSVFITSSFVLFLLWRRRVLPRSEAQ